MRPWNDLCQSGTSSATPYGPRAWRASPQVLERHLGSVVSSLSPQALQPQLSPLPHPMNLTILSHWAPHYSLHKKNPPGTLHLCICCSLSLEYPFSFSDVENSCLKFQLLWEAHSGLRQAGSVALALAPAEVSDVWPHSPSLPADGA